MKLDWSWLGWCAVLLAWAALRSYEVIGVHLHEARAATATAIGRVTSSYPGWQSRDDGEPSRVEYVFVTANGVSQAGADDVSAPVGASVAVRYNPRDPRENFLGDASQSWVERLLLPLLMMLAGGYGLAMELRSNKTRGASDGPLIEASRWSDPARFVIVLLSGLSMYFLFGVRFNGPPADDHLFARWLASLTFVLVAVFAYRWRIWWALALAVSLALLLTPLLPVLELVAHFPGIWLVATAALFAAATLVRPPAESMDSADLDPE